MMSAFCEDPAAGAGPADRRARVRLLPVPAAADAVQPRARGEGARAAIARRSSSALEAEFAAAFERARRPPTLAAEADDATSGAARAFRDRREVKRVRGAGAQLVREVTGDERYKDRTGDTPAPDVNYVFPTFVTTQAADRPGRPDHRRDLRGGDVDDRRGAQLAGDVDRHRHLSPAAEARATDAHYLERLEAATGFWGVVACVVAMYAAGLGSLIEVVNRFGSFFYGSLLGVFVLALGFRRSTGTGAFVGLLAGMAVVAAVAFHPATSGISFLWHNPDRRDRRRGRRLAGEPDDEACRGESRMKTAVARSRSPLLVLAPAPALAAQSAALRPRDRRRPGDRRIGQPPRRADVAISQGRIAAIGVVARRRTREVIDASRA